MGSLEEAAVTGFMCRLCSSINKRVVHLFGIEHLSLLKKIAVTVEVKVRRAYLHVLGDLLKKFILPKWGRYLSSGG